MKQSVSKLISILFVMVFALVGCGDSINGKTSEKDSSSSSELAPGTTIYYNSRPSSGNTTTNNSKPGDNVSSSNQSSSGYNITVQSKPESSQEVSSSSDQKEENIKYIKYNFKHLANTYAKLTQDKSLRVGFLGGSVTDGTGATNAATDGWPRLVCKSLAEEYDAFVDERRQSIGGTGSYFGAFRYTTDIGDTSKKQPDLLFIEFAINDNYIGDSYEQVVKNSESLIRKAYSLNPKMDIVYVLTFDKGRRLEDYEQLRAHKDVAAKYGLLCINLREILGPTIDFSANYSDDVHPNTAGYQTYANEIIFRLMECMPQRSEGIAKVTPKNKTLPKPMSDYYKNLKLVKSSDIDLKKSKNWKHEDIDFSYVGRRYGGLVSASKNGAKLVIKFKGDEFALVYNGGPDMGKVDVSIDGGEAIEINAFMNYNNPRIKRIPVSGSGEHTVTVTLKGNKTFHLGAYTYD